MSNQVAVIPVDLPIPAHLRTPEMLAQIARENAEAAGGIKSGGFPKISIKGGKFHIKDQGETTTLFDPPSAPGQPPLPKMLLEVVVVASNKALSKVYYPGDWQEGSAEEPTCQSRDGITPNADAQVPQSTACATCPQNQWGSKISKATGKEVKACSDIKNLVVLAAQDLGYKALGFDVTPAALSEWGQYVKALSARQVSVSAVVTNVTFDHTASFPKLKFSFSRYLTAEEFAKVQQRAQGDDVKTILNQGSLVAPIALPPPASTQPAAPPATSALTPPSEQPTGAVPPAPAAAPVTTGFGAGAPAAQPEEPAKRSRKPRAPDAETQAAMAQAAAMTTAQVQTLTPDVQAAVAATGAQLDPFAGLPPHVKAACDATGATGTPAFLATYKALAGKDYPTPAPAMTAPPSPPPVAPAPTGGFGGVAIPSTAPQAVASAAAVATAGSLAERLRAKLNGGAHA